MSLGRQGDRFLAAQTRLPVRQFVCVWPPCRPSLVVAAPKTKAKAKWKAKTKLSERGGNNDFSLSLARSFVRSLARYASLGAKSSEQARTDQLSANARLSRSLAASSRCCCCCISARCKRKCLHLLVGQFGCSQFGRPIVVCVCVNYELGFHTSMRSNAQPAGLVRPQLPSNLSGQQL